MAIKVSVITPTFGRPHHLRYLVRFFQAQTYPEKELLILDDSPEASEEMQLIAESSPEISYIHHPERLSIGKKRNMLIEKAQGEIIVQFDDDDYYASAYIQAMVNALGDEDFITLSGWYAYNMKDQIFAYWDTSAVMKHHYVLNSLQPTEVTTGEFVRESLITFVWGYGFSYVFKKTVFPTVQFEDINFGEDFGFVQNLYKNGFQLKTVPDQTGFVLHMLHENNTSRIFPQYILPPFLLPDIFGPDILNYEYIKPTSLEG